MRIIARNKEQEVLQTLLDSGRPEFLAIYGRRRVGKTYLIRNFFAPKTELFHITGVPDTKTNQQLWNFAKEFSDVFNMDYSPPKTWSEAFDDLRKQIAKRKKSGRIVLFFDELPWLASRKSGFIQALTLLWNRYLCNEPSVLLVVCGSAASWVINNIIDAHGGLHNRLTCQLRLQPFQLGDTERYLNERGVHLDRYSIVQLYMAIGGIPAYLDKVLPGHSAAQTIGELCFSQEGNTLYGEFNRLFSSLFGSANNHLAYVRALAKSKQGLTRKELVTKTKTKSVSVQRKVLRELIESGFVTKSSKFAKRSKEASYRLVDHYSLFYLHWLESHKYDNQNRPAEFWLSIQQTPSWRSWSGLAFENLVLTHTNALSKALGISGIQHSYHTWRHAPDATSEEGAQIDLVLDRADNTINLCEIKYTPSQLTVTKTLANELNRKREIFSKVTGSRKSLFNTLITLNGASRNEHYLQAIQNEITAEDLFI